MRRLFWMALPLLLMTACQRPEVEAFQRKPLPIVVSFKVAPDYPRADGLAKEYAAVLRARLASRVTVVPEGVAAPDPSAELQVEITRIRSHSDPSPAAVGVVTGVAVGTLSALAGNRDAAFDGFFWGIWAGTNAAQSRNWDRERLGYAPTRVSAVVRLVQQHVPDPLEEFDISAQEVIDQMDSLRFGERDDEGRIQEEEAKAFARVVVARLQEDFHWLPLPEPSYYQGPDKARANEPKSPPAEAAPSTETPQPSVESPAPDPVPAPDPATSTDPSKG